MATPGKSSGRVSVRVVPDSTGFRDDLKKVLDRAEKSATLAVRITADGKGLRRGVERETAKIKPITVPVRPPDLSALTERLAATQRRLQGNPLHLQLRADVAKAERELIRFKQSLPTGPLTLEVQAQIDQAEKQIQDLRDRAASEQTKVTFQANLDAALARFNIARLTRTRFVQVVVNVNKRSIASAATAIAALSGGRVVGTQLQNLGRYLADFDKHVPKIAAVSLAIGAIGASALSSVAGLLTLGASLTQLTGLAGLYPAVMGAAAVSIGVFSLAMVDAKDRLADLAGPLQQFQKSISGEFWKQAEEPIRRMTRQLLPQLQTQLGAVSTGLGQMTADLAASVTENLGGGALTGMIGDLTRSIQTARGAIDPLVRALVQIGTVGSSFLPGLTAEFVRLSDQFGMFIARASADGSLQQWIQDGMTALSQLGQVIKHTAGILSGLAQAAATGGTGLGGLADALGRISAIVNGPTFQTALTTIFQGAREGAEGLAAALGPLGQMFSALAPTIADVMATSGQAIGNLLGQLAAAMSQPAFATGLTALFDGIALGLAAIGPALPSIVAMLGSLGQVAGTLAGTIGAVLGAAFQALAPAVIALATAITPLVPILGAALIQAVQALAPVLLELATTLGAQLPGIISALVPVVLSLVPAILQIVQAVIPLIPTLAQLVIAAIGVIGAVAPLVGVLASIVPYVVEVVNVVAQLVTALVVGLGGAFQTIGALIRGDFGAAAAFMESAARRMMAIVATATSGMRTAFTNFVTTVRERVSTGFQAIVQSVQDRIGRVVEFVRSLPGRVRSALGNLTGVLAGAGRDLIQGMINGMREMIGSLANAAADAARSALSAAKGALGINSPSTRARDEVGRQLPAGIIVGIERGKPKLDRAIAKLVDLPTVPGLRSGALGNLPTVTPTVQRSYTFGDTIGLTAEEVAAQLERLMRQREALEFVGG